MIDILNSNGLQTKSLSDLVSDLETALKSIYGSDINISSNSPDGQVINIVAQSGVDVRELITDVYNSFNPDTAEGTVLDERVTINNIERQGGTYTIVPIDITANTTVDLEGLDADFNNVDGTGFTVQDSAGNEFILIDSVTLTPGITTKNFRARNIGQVEVTLGTITTIKTVVVGVTEVTNSSAVLQTGTDEETNLELRIRRARSVANASFGYLNGLRGQILNLDGVTECKVYENYTDSVDSNGIPAHGIWCIVQGGANAGIAQEIYTRKNVGANMKGSVTVNITTPSGIDWTAKFDRPSAKDLYVRFDIQPTVSGASFNQADIKAYIVANKTYEIGDFAETSSLTEIASDAIDEYGGGGVPVNMEVSDDGVSWVDYQEVDTLDEQWTLDIARITITVL